MRIMCVTLFLVAVIGVNIAKAGTGIYDVTVAGFSSEDMSWADFSAQNTANQSGFNRFTGTHDNKVGTMWQAKTTDLNPWIIWYLGAVYSLDTMKVWNNNYYSSPHKAAIYGARNVDIYVSTDKNPDTASWTLVKSATLTQAPGTDSYDTPDVLDMGGVKVRLVKLSINTTYSGWVKDGRSGGLSEVWFVGSPASPQITDVTVAAFSSEDLRYGSRYAANTVNQSGFDPATGTHDTSAGTVWQSGDTDPHPWVVWDLQETHFLDTVKVWNFNHTGWTFFGIKDVDIYVSTDKNPDTASWTTVKSATLTQAPGTDLYDTPDVLDMGGVKARLVKFSINTIYAEWAKDGCSGGLSEVQFLGTQVQPR